MSPAKKEAIDLIQRLPDEATLTDIIEELFFKQQVDDGLKDMAEGRTISHADLKERLGRWRKSTGR